MENLYPEVSDRVLAPKNVDFYIDPNSGNDTNSGLDKLKPWKTFKNINKLRLSEGNTLEILSAGTFKESMFIVGEGTAGKPITVKFAPGQYDFFPENAVKRKFHISNTNDAPDSLKSIAFYFKNTKHLNVKGNGAKINFRGKVIEASLNNCEDIQIENLIFDYERPTVSEMTIVEVGDGFADAIIHKDSKFLISENRLIWIGEGWKHETQKLWQVYNPENKNVRRQNFPVEELTFSELEESMVRINFIENPGFKKGLVYQNRNTFRDYCAFFTQNSSHILWKDVTVNFMHGMGFVSQFSEDIVFDNLYVGVDKNSGRTCAAWADILHFSGCKGDLVVKDSYLSAANDDAINVHGTHLRIIGEESENTIRVKFMHPQTYGFAPFIKSDSVEFINSKTLLPFAKNRVSRVQKLNDKEFEVSFENAIPKGIEEKDVLENITWTSNLTVTNTRTESIPTRGFLVTTRGTVVIEENEFLGTHMSAILMANDANGWYESGYLRDVTVRKNKFINCGSPVINIHPENKEIVEGEVVHKNIFIEENLFEINNGKILMANSTGNLKFNNNSIKSENVLNHSDLFTLKNCIDVELE